MEGKLRMRGGGGGGVFRVRSAAHKLSQCMHVQANCSGAIACLPCVRLVYIGNSDRSTACC